ncbi:nitrate/nitrite two-component system sensor histidine kinase NarQ [Enterobacteriaceae bacterium YMB-R22]|nr:nitrate/nitrite two-component system sensor histidine kinase NarQ [Tenebrionicola larvae]
MMVKRPVSTSLARAFFYIVLLSLLTTGMALSMLASSMRDAEAINLAGSLRMQSWRLGYDLQGKRDSLTRHRAQYEKTLRTPLLSTPGWLAPQSVRERYATLYQAWQEMDARLARGDLGWYQKNIDDYVAQIDLFVLALQHHAESKMALVVAVSAVGFFAIFTLVFFTLRRIRRQVVEPLNALVAASQQVERGVFTPPELNAHLPNELGLLGHTFTRMAGELRKLYQSLEANVQQKTQSLKEANRRLEVLYNCSQALSASTLNRRSFERILTILRQDTQLTAVEMRTNDNWLLQDGMPDASASWSSTPVLLLDNVLGELRWQSQEAAPSNQLMESVANMLGRAIGFNQVQKHRQQLLLMEERATIARELHDSLAQALSYLRIQLTLLRRALPEENHDAHGIINDFSQALNDAYRQLRELLSTFRLTLQQANFTAALKETLVPLRARSAARITLESSLPDQTLDAQRQIHLLQIIREAVLNAIRHADARTIAVRCFSPTPGVHEAEIVDDGCGIASPEEPEGHYGLNIMQERAERLGGVLTISRPSQGGTRICVRFCAAADTKADNDAYNDNTSNLPGSTI